MIITIKVKLMKNQWCYWPHVGLPISTDLTSTLGKVAFQATDSKTSLAKITSASNISRLFL